MSLRIRLTKKPDALLPPKARVHCKILHLKQNLEDLCLPGLFSCSEATRRMAPAWLPFSSRDFSQRRFTHSVFFLLICISSKDKEANRATPLLKIQARMSPSLKTSWLQLKSPFLKLAEHCSCHKTTFP